MFGKTHSLFTLFSGFSAARQFPEKIETKRKIHEKIILEIPDFFIKNLLFFDLT
jgi:hypothetical protein